MKHILLILMAMTFAVSCATNRSPSSVEPESVEDGMHADYYGTPSLR